MFDRGRIGIGFLLITLGILSARFLRAQSGATQLAPDALPGIEVLTRGPIHEAFAQPLADRLLASPLVPKPPPPPIEEVAAEQKPEGRAAWIPGYWMWENDRANYVWVSGCWRVPPPGQQWIPGHWHIVGTRWQWVSGFWTAQQALTSLSYLPPPPPGMDSPPLVPPPGTNYYFVAGTWVYRGNRYDWRSGYWVAYHPNWLWVPARYLWTPGGYLFFEGFWDYPLHERGLLFAPVALDTSVSSQPGFVYRPAYVVHYACLAGALFVRPNYRHYYFGDYFERQYQALGYVAWFDMKIGSFSRDPLFEHERLQHAEGRRWEQAMRAQYSARKSGQALRPPASLVEQFALLRRSRENNLSPAQVKEVTMVSPLVELSRAEIKLQPVSEAARLEVKQAAQRLAGVSRQRQDTEGQGVVRHAAPKSRQSTARTAELQTPSPAFQLIANTDAPPPLPIRPDGSADTSMPATRSAPPAPMPAAPLQPIPPGKK